MCRIKFGLLCLILASCQSKNEKVLVAVASNAYPSVKKSEVAYEAIHGDVIDLVSGSSGKFCIQIINGAPYAVFLSANTEYPALLYKKNLSYKKPETYAEGRLAYYAKAQKPLKGLRAAITKSGRIAIAQPDVAPYGKAAFEVLNALQMLESVKSKVIYTENIGLCYTMAKKKAVDGAFIALSYALQSKDTNYYVIPNSLHKPIKQDAILLNAHEDFPEHAYGFYNFLFSGEARQQFIKDGYN